jgi:GntR family transcriptional regulator, vanillate catabolism transcriptional regulator
MAALTEKPDRSQITRALLTLREQILSGQFKAGERMSELPLVERIGVSRTPLRLALAALEHEGLLEQLPTGGYVVRAFTAREIVDAIELRGVLEGTAARFAAERGAPRRELRALAELNDRIGVVLGAAGGVDSFDDYVELNERFHTRVFALAGSSVLERALAGVAALPFAGPSAFILPAAEMPESYAILVVAHRQHAALLEAISAREGTRAEAVAREHARLALTNLEIVRHHREMFARLPGASLVTLDDADTN